MRRSRSLRMPMVWMGLISVILIFTEGIVFAGDDAQPSRTRLALRQLVGRAEAGDPKALFDLSSLHERGYDSIPVDSARSLSLLIQSAQAGYAPAQNYLGFRLYGGNGIDKDPSAGLEWLEKAAVQGDAKAANNLGWILLEGQDVVHDDEKAAFWFRMAADAGLPAGLAQYADLLRTGRGVPADTLRADSLYSLAIEAGLQDAELKLLAMQRERWRNLSPPEALALGMYHYTHRAPMIGVTLFEQIASQGPVILETETTESSDSVGGNPRQTLAKALSLLGDAHTRARGTSYDHDLSIKFFTEAAILGEPSAQFIVGELLEIFPDALSGLTLPEWLAIPSETDRQTPAYWYERAAEAGITDAATANRRLLSPNLMP